MNETKKFRKKPVVIEAIQWDGEKETAWEITEWAKPNVMWWFNQNLMAVTTLEGDMNVSIGDWVIKGVKGEFYPCKPDIFEATYEEVKDD